VRIVPMFWLASEDHDLQEINHAFYQQSDGEVGRVAFGWEEEGRPVADMPLHLEIRRAWDAYWEAMRGHPHRDTAMAATAPRDDESYARWQARVWSSLFASLGLVVVEPRVVRPLGAGLMAAMASAEDEIGLGLRDVAARLQAAGYQPALDPVAYGRLFTLDGTTGRRVRVADGPAVADDVERHSQRYSTDAALRPVLADAILPVLANVLGPGELAYHAMLGPVYEALDVPQPVAFPRKSYTLVTTEEANRLAAYGTSPRSILQQAQEPSDAADGLASREHRRLFRTAQHQIDEAYAPLKDYVMAQDPNLAKTWESTLGSAKRALEKLEERALKAALSRQGLSKGDYRALRNRLLPRDRPQERVYPLAWHLARHGPCLLKEMLEWGELDGFQHDIVTWEDQGADM
jgi:bacillithiol synthase